MKTRYERKLEKRDKRIAGMQRRIQHLESALAEKSLTSEKLKIDVKKEVIGAVHHALMNVRFIPVHNFLSTPEVVFSVEKKVYWSQVLMMLLGFLLLEMATTFWL